MKNRKPLIIIILLFILIISSSCRENRKKIGILIYSSDDNALNATLEKIKDDLSPKYDLIIYDAEKSQMLQNDQFLSLIDAGCEVILVNLVDRLSASTYVDKAKRVNVPIVFFNREPIWDDLYNYNKAYYVGINGEAIGKKQAKIAERMFDNPSESMFFDINNNNQIEMVVLKGEQGHQTTETIFSSCINELKDNNYQTKILATEYSEWNRKSAKEIFKKMYYSPQCQDDMGKSSIELVICNNDEIALGVIDFIFEEGIYYIDRIDGSYIMPFTIIGANSTIDSLEAVKMKYIYGTISGEEKRQAAIISYLSDKLTNKKEVDLTDFEDVCYPDGENIYKFNRNFIYVNGNIIYRD